MLGTIKKIFDELGTSNLYVKFMTGKFPEA